jgi:acetyltransferase-like isoleucine patch superfamily enzyme
MQHALATPARPRSPFTRVRRALGRYSLRSIAGGLWVGRHFQRTGPVVWSGELPLPKIINEGGTLETEGCGLGSGVRLEIGDGARLSIGAGTYIHRNGVIVAHERVEIGRNCLISWDVVIIDDDHHDRMGVARRIAPVVIGDGAWIGCRAIVLKGVTIGEGALVAANAVVTRDVPPHTLVAGQPARVIRELPRPGEAGAAEARSDALVGAAP